MSDLVRLSLSIEKPLYERLEKLVKSSGCANRSEFVRDLVRRRLVEGEWKADRETLGTVTLLYDHHKRRLGEKLTELQHHHHHAILASTHVHLDRAICAEVIIIRGRASEIRSITDMLRKQKGVLHAELSLSSTGKNLA